MEHAEPAGVEPAETAEVPVPAEEATVVEPAEGPPAEGAEAAEDAPQARPGITPVGGYMLAWLAFVGGITAWMWAPGADVPFVDIPGYVFTLVGGAVLTVAGPLVSYLAWRSASRSDAQGPGSMAFALLKGSAAAFAGVALWAAALIVLDLHRTGW